LRRLQDSKRAGAGFASVIVGDAIRIGRNRRRNGLLRRIEVGQRALTAYGVGMAARGKSKVPNTMVSNRFMTTSPGSRSLRRSPPPTTSPLETTQPIRGLKNDYASRINRCDGANSVTPDLEF
jgi:hypothetical protein